MGHARDIMHRGVECIGENDSLYETAIRMRELDVGSMPVCGDDDMLKGIVTDRDIVLRCVAEGHDAMMMTAGELAQGKVIWVDADADENEVLRLMEDHQIRRLPVMDRHRLVGIISEADVARSLSDDKISEFVERVYAAR